MKLIKSTGFFLIAAMAVGAPILVAANDFGDDFASGNSSALIETLRNGEDLSYDIEVEKTIVDETGAPILDTEGNEQTEIVIETVTVVNSVGSMGFGEISLALGLAGELLGDDASYETVVGALYNDEGTGILDKRDSGMGWGKIFLEEGTTVGAVMSDLKASERALAMRAVAKNRAENRPQRADASANRPSRIERPERADRPDRLNRPERPEPPARPGRP